MFSKSPREDEIRFGLPLDRVAQLTVQEGWEGNAAAFVRLRGSDDDLTAHEYCVLQCNGAVMSGLQETGRLAGHTLVDALSVRDERVSPAVREAATEPAIQRLRDIDAVTVSYDDDEGRVDVDVTDIVSPAVMAMIWLASRLSEATGEGQEEICAQLREYFDAA